MQLIFKKNWHWQEKGAIFLQIIIKKMIKSESKRNQNDFMPFIWFSFKQKILKEATHIVLINSFNNFLPLSNKRNLILRF